MQMVQQPPYLIGASFCTTVKAYQELNEREERAGGMFGDIEIVVSMQQLELTWCACLGENDMAYKRNNDMNNVQMCWWMSKPWED